MEGGSSSRARKADKVSNKSNYERSFSVFVEEFRISFNEEHPNNKSLSAAPRFAAAKWNTMTDDEKAPYVEKAKEGDAEFEKFKKDYVKKMEKAPCVEKAKEGDAEFEKFKKDYVKKMKLPHGEITQPYNTRGSLKRGVEESKGKRPVGNYDTVMKRPKRPCRGVEVSSIKSLDQIVKERPMYFLFESGSGYALLLAHDDLRGIKDTYECAEKFINRQIDEIFKLVAFHPFASTDDALSELNAISKGIVSDQLIKFLVDSLPKVTDDGPKFALTLEDAEMVDQIVMKTRITCGCCLFHKDIMRGVRMHFDKFIKDFMVGDLKKGRLDLARLYSRKMVNSA